MLIELSYRSAAIQWALCNNGYTQCYNITMATMGTVHEKRMPKIKFETLVS